MDFPSIPAPGRPAGDDVNTADLDITSVSAASFPIGFDDFSELVRRIAGADYGVINVVDQDRRWFRSCAGGSLPVTPSPHSVSLCGHTILQREPLIVPDALLDSRFAENPLVVGEPGIRSYAGFPLITPSGFALGSLCAISCRPHQLTVEQIDSLQRLASLTVQHLHHLRHGRPAADATMSPDLLRPLPTAQSQAAQRRLISRDQLLQMLELILATQVPSPFSLLRCRFRDYDRVSATLGAPIAEEFLQEGARRVLAALPRSCSVARFADADFMVLLPFDADLLEVRRVAERLITLIDQVYRSGTQALAMGVSIGIAQHRNTYDSVDMLLADTSMALRTALRTAGSSFRFVDPKTRVEARESYRLESELREAIKSRSLEPHLQPIVDLVSGEPIGFEALARWRRGTEVLAPGTFLPSLSESGITGELDLLIIEKALAAIPLLALPIPQRPMTMSVNLSGILLEDPDLRLRLLELIDDNPLPVGWVLQVELVEDAFQDLSDSFADFLGELVRRAVSIAIDDFGTGYSSLARLVSLPLQGVKVDRAFVSRLDDPGDSQRTLLRTMLAMLNDLGLSITAEGVETSSQRDWLAAHGVTRAQGYLFHRPLPIAEAIELLQTLDYRPGAIPVETARLRGWRRRGARPLLRLPFLDRRRPQS